MSLAPRKVHRSPVHFPAVVLRRLLWGILLLAVAPALPSSLAAADSIRVHLADGFDFPVGKPDGYGYYKARGFWPNGHLGGDWNGRGGGNSDLGDPVYSIGHGVVVYSNDFRVGWGNIVIVRHAYRETNGRVYYVDSLYGHLDRRLVKVNDRVKRGQHIGTIGTNHGMYLAHLHFEIRKNIAIGTNRSKFGRGYSNYHSPTSFIEKRRKLRASFRSHSIPIGFPDGSSSGNAIVIDVNSPPPPDATQAESSKLPTEVEKALRGVPEDKEKDTRGFWQKIKERLTFRFRKREDSRGSDFRRR